MSTQLQPRQQPRIEVITPHAAQRSKCPVCNERVDYRRKYGVIAQCEFGPIAFFAPVCQSCATRDFPALGEACELLHQRLGPVEDHELPTYARSSPAA